MQKSGIIFNNNAQLRDGPETVKSALKIFPLLGAFLVGVIWFRYLFEIG